MRRFILSFISLLAVGLLSAQTSGYNPDSPDEPFIGGLSHRLYLIATPSGGGYFNYSSSVSIYEGDSMYLYAYPSSGYKFVCWKKNNTVLSTTQRIMYTMGTSNDTLTAEFVYDPTAPSDPFTGGYMHRLNLVASPSGAGSFSSYYSYYDIVEGDSQLVRAYPNNGYRFVSWNRNGSVVSTSNPYRYVMGTSNDVLTAVFVYDPTAPADPLANGIKHYLNLVYSPSNAISYYISRIEMVEGDSQYVYAYPRRGYEFVSWEKNGVTVSTDNPFLYVMGSANDTLTAVCVYNPVSPENPGHDYFYEDYGYICSGDTVHWHGHICTTTGEYYDSLTSVYGSDSIFKLTLVVFPSFFEHTVQSIPVGASYTWRGRTLTSEGVYYDSLYTMYGCDSIYKLTLRIASSYYFEEEASICQGETYSWHGRSYNAAGIYYDSLVSVEGLDSVYKLTLKVNPVVTTNVNLTACENGPLPAWATGATPGIWTHDDTLTASTGCDSIIHSRLVVYPTYSFSQSLRMSSSNVPYLWHGKSLNVSGTYYDSLQTRFGCDSIYQLDITFIDPYLFRDSATICQGETYTWRNRRFTASGIYYDSLKTADNVDSVYQLKLTVYPVVTTNINLSLCSNEQLPAWATGFAPGRYHRNDTLTASTGCDSIIHTLLTINRTYSFQQTVRKSSAEAPYSWHGLVLTVSGTYFDSLSTVNGCDSVYQLNLTFIDPYLFRDSATICQGETYNWRSRRFTVSGTYYDSLKTSDNVDSVYQLTLTVNPVVTTVINISACANEPLPAWAAGAVAGNTYHHYDTLSAVTGCDSIIHTLLKVNPTFFNQQNVVWPMAMGNYNWHGKVITASGVYFDSLTTVNTGCDSIFKLNITFADKYLFEESHSICQGDYYDWRGQRYTQAGVYYDSLKTPAQVDSIYKLTLTVNQNYFFTDVQTICQGSSYLWHNRNLTVGGVYYDSLITTSGCDSVYELTLTVNPTYFVQERNAICQGDVYQWHNRNLSVAGTYYDSLTTTVGCDSVYELTLLVNQTYFMPEQHTICQGDYYQWHSRNLNAAGVYYDSLLTVSGCDSVFELTLTVNGLYLIQEQHSICQGETYQWHYRNLTVEGVYYDSLITTSGCDSVYELALTVNPAYFIQERHSICQGDVYQWHGLNLNVAGVYYDSLTTTTGCDSVYELTLRVNPAYFVQEQHTICQGDYYQWHGRNLNAAGIYYDSLQTVSGCDSVFELTLTVNTAYLTQEQYSICQGETYQWHYRNLTDAGVYYDSLITTTGCDSVYELTLTVNPTYKVEDSAELPEDGSGYEWHGKVYKVAGDYVDTLATAFGCDSICTLHLKDAETTALNDVRTIEITLAPNPIRTDGITYIYADWTDDETDNMTVEVVTMTGVIVSRIKPESFPVPITGINSTGIYFIRITTGSGDTFIRKLIVH